MSDIDYTSYSKNREVVENKRDEQHRVTVKVEQTKSTPIIQPQSAKVTTVETVSKEKHTMQDLETKLESIGIDSTVIHKKFGKGKVVKINKNDKFIHVKFTLGEKKFVFPDAFIMGFLEV
jgi:hypothetical protein